LTKIKICGLTRLEDIKAVNQFQPDFIGFVFANSKRQVNKSQAKLLKANLLPEIKSVGIFVNESMELITELCEEGIIDMIQLHGDEKEEYIRKLEQFVSCPVIKAISVQSKEQIELAEKLPVGYLLLDTYKNGQHGGTGTVFDHSLIPELNKPYFLAGGLDLENITNAVKIYHPFAVDVSSSLETNGVKDADKIRRMIETVRNINGERIV
jgi:phosphoribosylanthranilate isomerase